MKILLVATKAPWPPIDGGRLLLRHTLEGLAAAGVRPTLVAPIDPERFDPAAVAAALEPWCEPLLVRQRPAGPLATLVRAALRREPLSIARHSRAVVRREVARLVAARRFDLVHAEQLQAVPQTAPAHRRGLPLVLRAQNVESALWAAAGRGRLGATEAARLAVWEGQAVAGAAATLALSEEDAASLRALARGGGRVLTVPAPFPASLPAGPAPLPGAPAVVVLGSRGWLPNRDAAAWFLAEIWPAVRRLLPAAQLHLFGPGPERPRGPGLDGPPGVAWHEAPADSAAAFARGSLHAVPLRIGSGVRMKVLEAWARGVPVVGTPQGLAGLAAADGRELLVAHGAEEFAAALARLHREPALADALVRGGRALLARRHDPGRVARQLIDVYEAVLGSV